MGTIDQETVEYKTVIGNLARLYTTITEKSTYSSVSPEIAEATQKIAKVTKQEAATAAKAAGSAAIRETAMAGLTKIAARMGGLVAKKAVGQFLGFTVWDTYEGYKAGREIKDGSAVENLLRDKIEELKEEAIMIVDDIFNVFADEENWMMPPIHNPF